MEIGSFYNLNFVKTHQICDKSNNLFYFSGRIAIKEILKKNGHNKYCLIPNYLCDSIYNCFNNFGFYQISNNFEIDLNSIKQQIKDNDVKLIYIINYFGYIDKNIHEIVDICHDHNIIVVEDFTHNMYSDKLYGDVCICSYRKSLATPFGSIVIDKSGNMKQSRCAMGFLYIFMCFLKIFGMMLKNFFWLKKIWRKILVYCENNVNKINCTYFDYINHIFYKYYYNRTDIEVRKRNIKFLHENLKIITLDKFKDTYFTYPIIFESREIRDTIRKILINNCVYCPIYWSLDFDSDNECNHYLSNRILCIPVDQRYNLENMRFIVGIVNQYL